MTDYILNLQLFAAGEAVNKTTSSAEGNNLSAEMKTFYDKTLITLASPYLVHDQFGQKRDIPKNGGKIIEFRRFSSLPKALTPLTEGVTPTGNKLNVSSVSATVEQYGDYIEQSDLLELTAVDNTIIEATKQLSAQAGLTMDTIVRNEIVGGTNVLYCPKVSADGTETAVTSRSVIDKTSLLRVKDVFKAAAELKAMNAPKIDGYYVGIIHPYVAYDLMQEAGNQWMEVQKYATPENMLNGEIGCLGGVRFVESTEAKIWKDGDSPAVFATLIIGADAYGVTSVTGGGVEHIVKQKGYGNDPLNQRSSIGWKGLKTAKRLVEEYLVRIESGSTFSGTAEEN